MKTKYRTSLNKIEAVDVEKETEKTIWFKENGQTRKCRKVSDFNSWHDTWADAQAYLLKRAQKRADRLAENIERARGDLLEIMTMEAK